MVLPISNHAIEKKGTYWMYRKQQQAELDAVMILLLKHLSCLLCPRNPSDISRRSVPISVDLSETVILVMRLQLLKIRVGNLPVISGMVQRVLKRGL